MPDDSSPAPRQTDSRSPLLGRVGAVALFIGLWLAGSWFLRGDLGLWNDDYQFAQRLPDGSIGQVSVGTLEFTRRDHIDTGTQFWRPLHFIIFSRLLTYTYHEHAWVAHTLGALAHAFATFLLWWFLRTLGRSRDVSLACAAVFLTYPATFQVVFWPAATSTGLAASTLIGCMLLTAGIARRKLPLWSCPLVWVLAFGISCFNEQAAAGLPAVALVYLALCPPTESIRARLLRSGLITAGAGAACVLYLYLYISTSNPGLPGTEGSYRGPGEWAARVEYLIPDMRSWLLLHSLKNGAFDIGIESITLDGRRSLLAMVLMGALVALGGVMLVLSRPVVEPGAPDPRNEPESPTRAWVFSALAGVVIAVMTFVPLVLIRQYTSVDSRLMYAPLMGLLVVVGALLDGIIHVAPGVAKVMRRPALIVLVLVASLMAVMQVGIQETMRRRYEMDMRESAALKRAFPNPPAWCTFAPLRIDTNSVWTNSPRLDAAFQAVWSYPWTSFVQIRHAIGKIDVQALHCWPRDWGHNPSITQAFPPGSGPPEVPGPGFRISTVTGGHAWMPDGKSWYVDPNNMIPFMIDASGAIRFIDRVHVERLDNADFTFEFPVVIAAEKSGLSPMPWVLFDPGPVEGTFAPVLPWKGSDGAEVAFGRPVLWNSVHTVTRLEAGAEMTAQVPPTAGTSRLLFRAALDEQAARGAHGDNDGATVRWLLDGQVIGEALLTRRDAMERLRSLPVSIELPASGAARTLTMRIEGPGGGAEAPAAELPVYVTHGIVHTLP